MKAAELKELSVEELTRKAGELRENLFNLKIPPGGTLEATSDVTKNKRTCADPHAAHAEDGQQQGAAEGAQNSPSAAARGAKDRT